MTTRTLPITAQSYVNQPPIIGNAGIRDYPWDYAHSGGLNPDPHGPDTKFVSDGLIMSGGDWRVANQEISQVAGTGLILGGTQGGVSLIGRASDVHVHSAINGVRFDGTDIQADHLNVDNIIRDGITVNGGGNCFINTSHVSGAKRGFVFNQRVQCDNIYPDSTEDGIVLGGWSHGSVIRGVNIGPGTNWHRSIIIQSTANNITGISGEVRAPDAAHPDIACCEFMPGTLQNHVSGWCLIPSGAKGFIVRGDCNELHVTGGGWWYVDPNNADPAKRTTTAVLVVLDGKITRTKIVVFGHGDSGTVVDARTAQLDETDDIDIYWDGSATPFVGDMGKAHVTIHEIKK